MDKNSLAWHVAYQCKQEGAEFVITNTEQAISLAETNSAATELGCTVIACDATNVSDIENLLEKSQEILGGKIDFILHSVAMSQNLRRHRAYPDSNYEYYNITLDVSAVSLHKILQTCIKTDALAEGASVVTLSFIASERFMEGYGEMSDAKALLESIVRNMGGIYGQLRKVRINAISQSPTQTRAEKCFPETEYFHKYADKMAPLGRATATDCANLCVMLFSDYTKGLTMQTLYNDGGFSQTVLSGNFMDSFRNAFEDKK
ncbi:MAG: SDR family oxidoreductase [Paludibacteraceae bacterium]|nr:SDR family oxidoreductase [Paludibacteraceae bacterium]